MSSKKRDYTIFYGLAIVILIISLAYYYPIHLKSNIGTDEWKHTALFGDSFGGLNAIFSGLAFAGVIITILLQRNELKLQREELKAQRLEFETQNETLKLQRFESIFFNMVSVYHEIVNSNEHDFMLFGDSYIKKGRDIFNYQYRYMKSDMDKVIEDTPYRLTDYTNIYNRDYNQLKAPLGNYFRNLYRVIKIIDESELKDITAKYQYTSIIRAQLSDIELVFLFFNGLSDIGNGKFKRYIETYGLLKNLNLDILPQAHLNNLLSEYEKSAYCNPFKME